VEIFPNEYGNLVRGELDSRIHNGELLLIDHLGGFYDDYSNDVLGYLESIKFDNIVFSDYVFSDTIREKYSSLDIRFNLLPKYNDLEHLHDYNLHPEINFKNLVCSFNGSTHVGRQLLTSIMERFGLFNPVYSSKNFSYSKEHIDGHFLNFGLSKTEIRLYRKFFVNSDKFLNALYSFGHVQYDHSNNIYNLEYKLTESFIHIVSETMSTSYYPFVTEKFLYSVVTRGLFVANAQPKWHNHLEEYYGFKKFNNIFDYSFDDIENPVERLVRLMEMVAKFSMLSVDDWNDLYLMEQDTIEYNYDHYFSKDYLKKLKEYEN